MSPVSRLCLSLVPCPLSYVPVSCLPSSGLYVSRLSALPPVRYPQSYFSVPCLSNSVTCFTSLFLVSRHLYPVSHDLSPIHLSQSPNTFPLTQCPIFCGYILSLIFPPHVLVPPSLVLCPSSFIFHTCDLRECVYFLAKYHTNAACAYIYKL
jgi:hypothetical protein